MTTGTVGWVGVGNMSNNVFVPYYPMLLTDSNEMYEGYQVSLPAVTQLDEKPDNFCTWQNVYNYDLGKYEPKFISYPDGWRDSYYFAFEGLGSYVKYAEKLTGTAISDADKKLVQDKMTALQNEFNETFAKVELKNATETSRQMAAKAHATALAMIDYLTGENNLTGLAVLDKNGNAVTQAPGEPGPDPCDPDGSADVYSESQSGLTLVPSSTAVNADIYAEPANPYANYVWHYDGSTTALSTASTYTVSSADQGKVLCLDVTVDGYKGLRLLEGRGRRALSARQRPGRQQLRRFRLRQRFLHQAQQAHHPHHPHQPQARHQQRLQRRDRRQLVCRCGEERGEQGPDGRHRQGHLRPQ